MGVSELEILRGQLDVINDELLKLLNRRGEIAKEIGAIKKGQGMALFNPVREAKMLEELTVNNFGPFDAQTINKIFTTIFQACLDLQTKQMRNSLLVSRENKLQNTVIEIADGQIGGASPTYIFGPCSVESYEQVDMVANALVQKNCKFIRGGAFKPRTSPYDFQGLGIDGLKILRTVANKYNLLVVSEIMGVEALEQSIPYIDVLQIGARNMHNVELLRAVGETPKPVLLKRGFSATLDEFIMAAEYIMLRGNKNIILCERGIRTYETATRNTLDITAIPILKKETHLPVLVDVSHATGRRDLLMPASKAALSVGADGIMVEVHPQPERALSDPNQQINLTDFSSFVNELNNFSKHVNKN